MSHILALTVSQYLNLYQRAAIKWWENMGPREYGIILITVFVIGWLLMKSAR